jgi:hypothetical protein
MVERDGLRDISGSSGSLPNGSTKPKPARPLPVLRRIREQNVPARCTFLAFWVPTEVPTARAKLGQRRDEVHFPLVNQHVRIRPGSGHEVVMPDEFPDPCPRDSAQVKQRDAAVAKIVW